MGYDYLDVISAIKAVFSDAESDYNINEITLFAYGWLTAKGVPCDLKNLRVSIKKDIFNMK